MAFILYIYLFLLMPSPGLAPNDQTMALSGGGSAANHEQHNIADRFHRLIYDYCASWDILSRPNYGLAHHGVLPLVLGATVFCHRRIVSALVSVSKANAL